MVIPHSAGSSSPIGDAGSVGKQANEASVSRPVPAAPLVHAGPVDTVTKPTGSVPSAQPVGETQKLASEAAKEQTKPLPLVSISPRVLAKTAADDRQGAATEFAHGKKSESAVTPTAPIKQKAKQPPTAPADVAPATIGTNAANPVAGKSTVPAGSDQGGAETKRLVKVQMESFTKECAPLANAKKDSGMFGMFSSGDNPVVTKCLEDLDAFVKSFWSFPETADALNLMASLNRTRKDAANEAISLAKLVYLHNDSPLSAVASGRLMGLALEDLKGERQTLKALSKGASLPDVSDRYFQFIKDIAKFEANMFLKLLRPQCDDFLMRFPAHTGAETVFFLREDSFYREKRHDLAAAGYRRILAVYPESSQRPGRLLTLGGIYDEQLKQYEDAVATYELLYNVYPDQPETLIAYQHAAKIHDEKLEKHANAVALLDRIVAKYPKEEAAQHALEYQAAIYTHKIRNYYSAIKAYQRLADMFKGENALNALVKAAELARNPVEDYDLQVELQGRIVAEYPASAAAIQALYDSAETYSEKLKNPKLAVSAYRQLIDNYPTSKLAEKAKTNLVKLNSGN